MRDQLSPYLKAGLFFALLTTLFGVVFYGFQADKTSPDFYICGNFLPGEVPMPPPPPPPPPSKPEVEEIICVVERMPLFPGCDGVGSYAEKKVCADRKLLEFVYGNITYPPEAITNCVEGMAVITFVVEKDGRVSETKIVRDPGAGTGDEALRVVKLINEKGLRFDPVSSSYRSVRVQYNLPVKFKLE
jgi:protein TonB